MQFAVNLLDKAQSFGNSIVMRLKSLLKLRRTKIVDCVDPFARPYDRQHHLVKASLKILEGKLDEAKLVIKNYHDQFKPKSTEEALGWHESNNIFPVFHFPWGTFKIDEKQKKDILSSRFLWTFITRLSK